jgi:hypothetical protein
MKPPTGFYSCYTYSNADAKAFFTKKLRNLKVHLGGTREFHAFLREFHAWCGGGGVVAPARGRPGGAPRPEEDAPAVRR